MFGHIFPLPVFLTAWCHLQSDVYLLVFCFQQAISEFSHSLKTGLSVWLYSVLLVRHAKDWRAGWRSVGWVRRPHWTTLCLSAQSSCDSGRILWYKAASLRSLCSHTRDALYFFSKGGVTKGESEWEALVAAAAAAMVVVMMAGWRDCVGSLPSELR